ncbi:RNA polymerase sigma factor [Spirillospora sp. CA-294931]|uniref:RNA polymerase sigma factor n=1 Tax=Spirillospora sp. CA-294931 TaxID=3240042 RepID=UPI003D9273E9
MRADPGRLYDSHAARLYAHCWSLVGDAMAAAALKDAFVAAVQHPPRGDRVLWLYALSRSACAELGAFTGELTPAFDPDDPLVQAAAELRPDHREALLLAAGEWLNVPDIARVLGIAPDTVRQLLHLARTRLERAVLDLLMRSLDEAGTHADVITAFEKGRLPQLLARRGPDQAPAWLRERVLAACEAEAVLPLTGRIAPNPLVVIGSDVAAHSHRGERKRGKGVGATAGLAAAAAAAVGLLAWPSTKGSGFGALLPSANKSQSEEAPRTVDPPRPPAASASSPESSAPPRHTPTPKHTPSPAPAPDRPAPPPSIPPDTPLPPGTSMPPGEAPPPETEGPHPHQPPEADDDNERTPPSPDDYKPPPRSEGRPPLGKAPKKPVRPPAPPKGDKPAPKTPPDTPPPPKGPLKPSPLPLPTEPNTPAERDKKPLQPPAPQPRPEPQQPQPQPPQVQPPSSDAIPSSPSDPGTQFSDQVRETERQLRDHGWIRDRDRDRYRDYC